MDASTIRGRKTSVAAVQKTSWKCCIISAPDQLDAELAGIQIIQPLSIPTGRPLMTKVLDFGYCNLVESWGSDERIIEAARMSTDKGFQGWGPIHEAGCGQRFDGEC